VISKSAAQGRHSRKAGAGGNATQDRDPASRTALVVGISSAVGAAIAQRLLAAGYSVVGSARPGSPVPIGDIKVIPLDVSNHKSMAGFLEAARRLGPFDFFTNTISAPPVMERFERIPREVYMSDYEIDVLSHVELIKGLLPSMGKGSDIIFVLSEVVLDQRLSYTASYQMSKYALLGLMNELSVELKSRGVRVNAVSPGLMETRFTARIPSLIKEKYMTEAGLDKLISPEHVADAIMRILADKSLVGENVPVLGQSRAAPGSQSGRRH